MNFDKRGCKVKISVKGLTGWLADERSRNEFWNKTCWKHVDQRSWIGDDWFKVFDHMTIWWKLCENRIEIIIWVIFQDFFWKKSFWCIGQSECLDRRWWGEKQIFQILIKHDHPISKWRMASLNTLLKTEVWRSQIQNQSMWILNGGFWPMVDSDQWWTNGGFWN